MPRLLSFPDDNRCNIDAIDGIDDDAFDDDAFGDDVFDDGDDDLGGADRGAVDAGTALLGRNPHFAQSDRDRAFPDATCVQRHGPASASSKPTHWAEPRTAKATAHLLHCAMHAMRAPPSAPKGQGMVNEATHFRILADAVEDFALFLLDREGVIRSWNPGARAIVGVDAGDAIGAPFGSLYPDDARAGGAPLHDLEVARSTGRFHAIAPVRRHDGDLFTADVLLVPLVVDGACSGFCAFVQDLTASRRLVDERDAARAANERLLGEALFRERFVATLTHDLRSPLQTASLAADLLLRTPNSDPVVRRWAGHITTALARLQRMITDLLDVDRIDAGGDLGLGFSRCDLHQIADELSAEMSRRHGERFVVVAEEGAIEGNWNEDALRRVLDNLLTNAVKYGATAGTIVTSVARAGPRVLLRVHNAGTPIPVDEQGRIFVPFHRTQVAQRQGKQGWGLGLTLVQGLVHAHHGQVKVESSNDDGTTFVVDLPVDSASAVEVA